MLETRPFDPDTNTFPFAAFRRLRFGRRPRCPRCGHDRIHGWGWFAGRRRYRCLNCDRTFSDFTGTPLAYLKRIDLWPRFVRCFVRCWSARRSARALGLHRNTAFRWRHLLLNALRGSDRTQLGAPVVVQLTRFTYSEKGGARRIRVARPGEPVVPILRVGRPTPPPSGDVAPVHATMAPRQIARAAPASGAWPARVWAVVVVGPENARESDYMAVQVGGFRYPAAEDVSELLDARVRTDTPLLTTMGRFAAPARGAQRNGHACTRIPALDSRARRAAGRLVEVRRWLIAFRGVSTKYLPNYLTWHELLRRNVTDPWSWGGVFLLGTFP